MSKNYYTHVLCFGNNIFYRGIQNGRRVNRKFEYSPTLYFPTNKNTEWRSLQGDVLEPKSFGSIREARDFIKRYEEVQNFKMFGNTRLEYAYIAEVQKGFIDWDLNDLDIAIFDIEVGSENGFPDPSTASEPVTAIAVKRLNKGFTVYGCGDFVNEREDVTYIKCQDEYTLLKTFITDWNNNCPDIISGWNIKFFDIPYLHNRMQKILGPDLTKKLSPWGYVVQREKIIKGKKQIAYDIFGVSCLDYIELYRWYAPAGKSQESYKLDHIASVELGTNKLDYSEYDNLHQLYKLNYQKFIEYNIKDVELIVDLEDKLKLIELAATLAYDTKTNFEDVFAQTRMWDALINSYLMERKIIVPPKENKIKDSAFEGAYVKEPQVGKHDWVASFDLNSLYPHLLIQYNISPETIIEPQDYTQEMRNIISEGVSVDRLLEKKIDTSRLNNVTLTPNGQYFRTDVQGFLPKMMEEMYEDRKKFKKLMIKAQQDYQVETDSEKKRELDKLIARYNNLQLAKKVSLNSAYGALGSQYFRFYDLRQALAVTQAGQLSIRWIEKKLNVFMNKLLKTDSDYVIASDTDSIYLRLGELVNKVYPEKKDAKSIIAFMDKVCEDKIQPFIDESYQELADYVRAFGQKMQMKREALADKGVWTAKKRYILNVYNNEGVEYKEPKLKVMGLEMIKSSTPGAIREKMRDIVEIMMKGTEQDVQDFILNFKEQFKKLPPEDISFPRGVNGISQYSDSVSMYKKGTPIHVKGAILYNHNLTKMNLTNKYPLIQEGEKIKFAYLKVPNTFKDTVVSFPIRLPKEFNLEEYIDYDTQFQKAFLEPIQVVLDCMNWKAEKQNSLEDFFS
jgi:DNA polymerase elongation subunit (family B)